MTKAVKDRIVDAISAPEERRSRPKKIQLIQLITVTGLVLSIGGTIYANIGQQAVIDSRIQDVLALPEKVLGIEKEMASELARAEKERELNKQSDESRERRIQNLEVAVERLQGVPETMARLNHWLDKQN